MGFDPPLSRWERRAVWLWIMVTGSAATGMAIGVFWWWIVFIIPIPLVIAAWFAPTAWLYLTPALLAWLALRRRPARGFLAAGAAMALVALAVPALFNARIDALTRAVALEQTGAPVSLRGVRTIALLQRFNGAYCSFDCLRLLITGRAVAVLIGRSVSGPIDPARRLTRLRLVPARGRPCPVPADQTHFSRSDAQRFAPRACVAIDQARLDTADLVLIDAQSATDNGFRRLPALPFVRHEQAVARVDHGRLVTVLRRSRGSGNRVAIPLSLWPASGADTSTSAFWGKGAAISTGPELPLGLQGLFVETVHVPEFDDPR